MGCKGEYDSQSDGLNNEFNNIENEFTQLKKVNGISISLIYKPTDLMVRQEIDNLKSETKINQDSIEKKYSKCLYFLLSYSKDNNELLSTIRTSRNQFNNIQNMLTFNMSDMVVLTNENNDTIPIVDYNFTRTYGLSKSTSLLFVFDRNKLIDKSDEINFKLKDIGIGVGDINFKYKANTIKNN